MLTLLSFSLWKAVAFTEASKFIRSATIQEVRASLRRWHQKRRGGSVWSRILPSLILFKEMTTTKNTCSLDDFLVVRYSIKQRIKTLWGRKIFTLVGRVESECSTAFRPRETLLFSRGEKVDLLFLVTVEKACLRDLQCSMERVESLAEQEWLFVLLFVTLISYWIRECLYYF